MPTYAYKAKDGPVRTVEGAMDAESRAGVLSALDARGLTAVWVRERSVERAARSWRVARGATFRDVTVFTRQLASLLRAGVPILRALNTVRGQTDGVRFRGVVREIEETVNDGAMLSEALARFPRLFSDLYVNMVRSGESAGVLDAMLARLAESRETEEEFRRKVRAAVAYPALVLVVGAATVFVLLAFFVPRVVELYRDFEDLPLPTRGLIGASRFFARFWHWLALAGGLAGAVAWRLARMERGRMFADRILLGLPAIGRLLREADVARFARTLGLLIRAGIPIDRALSLGAGALRNSILRGEIEAVRTGAVDRGMPISAGLRNSRHFPPLLVNMAAVGEEGGTLDDALDEAAGFYEKECEWRGRLLASLLEPLLILAVGGVVAFIVAAMLLPIFRLGMGL